jgi:hypothetical protein
MARDTLNSGGTGTTDSSAQGAAQQREQEAAQVLEDQAVAQALAAAQQAEENANIANAALNAANNNEDLQQMDPVAKRLSLLARINVQNINSEKNNRIAQGLKILQDKVLPFNVEEILEQPDMIRLNLTVDETTVLLEEFPCKSIIKR